MTRRTLFAVFVAGWLFAFLLTSQLHSQEAATIDDETYVVQQYGWNDGPVNNWRGFVPFAFLIPSVPGTTQLNHYDFSFLFGVPQHTRQQGVTIKNCTEQQVENLRCMDLRHAPPGGSRAFRIVENKKGELLFGVWYDGYANGSICGPAGAGPCSFIGKFVRPDGTSGPDALIAESELTSEGLTWTRYHGKLIGTFYYRGIECPNTPAFFNNTSNVNPPTQISAGAGGLDVVIPRGTCGQ